MVPLPTCVGIMTVRSDSINGTDGAAMPTRARSDTSCREDHRSADVHALALPAGDQPHPLEHRERRLDRGVRTPVLLTHLLHRRQPVAGLETAGLDLRADVLDDPPRGGRFWHIGTAWSAHRCCHDLYPQIKSKGSHPPS